MQLNGVEPQRYLTEVLIRLVNGWPQARIDEHMHWCLVFGYQERRGGTTEISTDGRISAQTRSTS